MILRSSPRRAAPCLALIVSAGVMACGSPGVAPTPTPSGGTAAVLSLSVSCPPSLLIGEKAPCLAVASLPGGWTPVVSLESTWSSTAPDVVAVDAIGLVHGKSAGQATVRASYKGVEKTATLTVIEEDAVRTASGQGQQGEFKPGRTVTLWLQGYYSVASAPNGMLTLRITNQRGLVAATGKTVEKGGDLFIMSSTFVIPDDSAEVCRSAVLTVGDKTIVDPAWNDSPLRCIAVQR